MNPAPRRIVTGLDAEGRSCVIIDGPVPDQDGTGVHIAWRTSLLPADNSGREDIDDTPFDFALMHSGGSVFLGLEYPPGMGSDELFWHATDTIDYIAVLRGEVVLVVETGEVRAGPGEFIVDRGVVHAWRNDGTEPAAIAVINLPAHPVGKGKTV